MRSREVSSPFVEELALKSPALPLGWYGARTAYAAFVFDGHMAVNGAILYGNNSALDLVASGNVWDLFVANMTLAALITA